MIWLITAIALGKDAEISAREVVDADPAEVYEALTDLSRWSSIWKLGEDDVPSHTRGDPGSLEQLLRWSSGQRARGRMTLVEADPDQGITYEITWNDTPGWPTSSKPLGHVGRIALRPEGTGTEVSWTVERLLTRSKRVFRVEKRLGNSIADAVGRLKHAVSEEPPARSSVEERDLALFWRGMHHRWTYNHRINRSGDWLTVPECDDDCTAEQIHAAASGSGADRATFDGYGTALTGPDIRGWYG